MTRSSPPLQPPAEPAGQLKLLRTVLVLSCMVSALAGLVAGYLIGLQAPCPTFLEAWVKPTTALPADPPAVRETSTDVLPPVPARSEPKPPQKPTPTPAPTPPAPTPPSVPKPATPPESHGNATPLQSLSPQPAAPALIPAPEAALKAFLAAPDWKSRALHVLHPERTTAKMEAYHATAPDGPTAILSLRADASHGDGEKDARLLSFLITTAEQPAGYPVAVVETSAGWKIDWETFVEFRDDHFGRFAAGQGADTGAFHVLVRNTHYFGEAFPGSDQLTAFRLDPPLPDRNHYAFVPTGSELHKTLAGSTEWGRPCAPVLQLVRKQHGDRKFHLEIESILAPNWRPKG